MHLRNVATLPLLKIDDVARRLNVSRATTYRLLNRGELRAVRVGGQLRVDPAELEQWLRTSRLEEGPS